MPDLDGGGDPFQAAIERLTVPDYAPEEATWLLDVCLRFVNAVELMHSDEQGAALVGVARLVKTMREASPDLQRLARRDFPWIFPA